MSDNNNERRRRLLEKMSKREKKKKKISYFGNQGLDFPKPKLRKGKSQNVFSKQKFFMSVRQERKKLQQSTTKLKEKKGHGIQKVTYDNVKNVWKRTNMEFEDALIYIRRNEGGIYNKFDFDFKGKEVFKTTDNLSATNNGASSPVTLQDIDKIADQRRKRIEEGRRRARRARMHVDLPPTLESLSHVQYPIEWIGKDFIVGVCKVQGPRPYMEDFNVVRIIDDDEKEKNQNDRCHILGVMDGHGGFQAAEFTKKRICSAIDGVLRQKRIRYVENESGERMRRSDTLKMKDRAFVKVALRDAFLRCNEQWRKRKDSYRGTCVSLCCLRDKMIHLANVGDSKIVLFLKDGRFSVLSVSHDTSNEEELERIRNMGLNIRKGGRVLGKNVTRSIGDFMKLKGHKDYIIADPNVRSLKRRPEFHSIVIASDGYWNNTNEQRTFEILKEFEDDPRAAATQMCWEVIKRCKDNVTCLVLSLKDEKFVEKFCEKVVNHQRRFNKKFGKTEEDEEEEEGEGEEEEEKKKD